MKSFILTFLLVFLAGCSSLPFATENSFQIDNVKITTHRDSSIKELEISRPDGLKIKVKEYNATANNAAIETAKADAEAKIAMLNQSAQTTNALIEALIKSKNEPK